MADLSGQVRTGETDQTTVPLATLPVVNAKKLRWAGRQLAIHAEDGTVQVGKLQDENGSLANLRSAGVSRSFRINQEGALVLNRSPGRMSVMRDKASGVTSGTQGQSQIAETTQPTNGTAVTTDITSEKDLAPAASADIVKLEVSSMRPSHTRRPLGWGIGN